MLIPIARVAPPTTANIAARTASLPGTLWRSRVNADTLVAVVRPSDRDHLCSEHSLDQETVGKLGVGPWAAGGKIECAGHEAKQGTKEAGHEAKKDKPVAVIKESGKGIGRAGEKVGKGLNEGVSSKSDREEREKQQGAEAPR